MARRGAVPGRAETCCRAGRARAGAPLSGRGVTTLAPLFTSHRQTWRTPTALYDRLHAEFAFTLDPCPPESGDYDGLLASWAGERVFVNPPYNACNGWIGKCYTEAAHAEVVVALVPARTDTAWWHDYAMRADELRFVRGRLRYDDSLQSAPFPSVIAVWRGANPALTR